MTYGFWQCILVSGESGDASTVKVNIGSDGIVGCCCWICCRKRQAIHAYVPTKRTITNKKAAKIAHSDIINISPFSKESKVAKVECEVVGMSVRLIAEVDSETAAAAVGLVNDGEFPFSDGILRHFGNIIDNKTWMEYAKGFSISTIVELKCADLWDIIYVQSVNKRNHTIKLKCRIIENTCYLQWAWNETDYTTSFNPQESSVFLQLKKKKKKNQLKGYISIFECRKARPQDRRLAVLKTYVSRFILTR